MGLSPEQIRLALRSLNAAAGSVHAMHIARAEQILAACYQLEAPRDYINRAVQSAHGFFVEKVGSILDSRPASQALFERELIRALRYVLRYKISCATILDSPSNRDTLLTWARAIQGCSNELATRIDLPRAVLVSTWEQYTLGFYARASLTPPELDPLELAVMAVRGAYPNEFPWAFLYFTGVVMREVDTNLADNGGVLQRLEKLV